MNMARCDRHLGNTGVVNKYPVALTDHFAGKDRDMFIRKPQRVSARLLPGVLDPRGAYFSRDAAGRKGWRTRLAVLANREIAYHGPIWGE